MPRKRTWLFLAAAALLLWLRPWRRLARRLQSAAPVGPESVHPEAAFSGGQGANGRALADAGPIDAILDRGADTLERAASDQAAALGDAGRAPGASEFAGPAFFGPGDDGDAQPEPDLIDTLLADEEEPDADAIMALDDELDAAAALDAVAPAETEALSAAPIATAAEEQGTVPASYLNLSAEAPGALIASQAAAGEGEAALIESEVGAEEPRRPDDLLVIEGIGPRTSTIVTAAGFTSFAQLAEADVETLRAALLDAGIKTVDPTTWPEQARLAADGRWDDLKELQGRIKNGRKTG